MNFLGTPLHPYYQRKVELTPDGKSGIISEMSRNILELGRTSRDDHIQLLFLKTTSGYTVTLQFPEDINEKCALLHGPSLEAKFHVPLKDVNTFSCTTFLFSTLMQVQ